MSPAANQILQTLTGHRDTIRGYGARRLGLFGSQARGEVDRVLQEILVRRTRAQVRATKHLAFPERAAPIALRYDAEWPVAIYDALEALTFAP